MISRILKIGKNKFFILVRHLQHLRTQNDANNHHLKEIPKKFQITGDHPNRDFKKYIDDIQALAAKDNNTIVYLVKVDIGYPTAAIKAAKKSKKLKAKSKKYNTPLKKKNMRLSNYEIIMRKLVDANSQNKVVINPVMTTDHEAGEPKVLSTTKIPVLKYKPIISRVRPKYERKYLIKPIKKNEVVVSVKTSKHIL